MREPISTEEFLKAVFVYVERIMCNTLTGQILFAFIWMFLCLAAVTKGWDLIDHSCSRAPVRKVAQAIQLVVCLLAT